LRSCRRRFESGISSIVGIAALILIFIAIIAFLLTVLYRLADFTQSVGRVLEEKAESESIIRAVRGTWSYDNSTITINVTSQYPQALLITGLTIVFEDGTKLILSKYNGTLDEGSYVAIIKSSSKQIKTGIQLPITLSPGHTTVIQVSSDYIRNKKVLIVVATLANPSTLVALPLTQL